MCVYVYVFVAVYCIYSYSLAQPTGVFTMKPHRHIFTSIAVNKTFVFQFPSKLLRLHARYHVFVLRFNVLCCCMGFVALIDMFIETV